MTYVGAVILTPLEYYHYRSSALGGCLLPARTLSISATATGSNCYDRPTQAGMAPRCEPCSSGAHFPCKSCSKNPLFIAPETPECDLDCFASRGSSSSKTVSLDDVMQQQKLTSVVLQQLRHSSDIVDSRLGLIQDSLAGMERTMAGIRSDVTDLSASHELLSERVAALEAI